MAPIREYLEFDPQPVIKIVYTLILEITRKYNILSLKSVNVKGEA
jgi:hypothetical protein